MVSDNLYTQLIEQVNNTVATSKRRPVSVYRLQFNKSFTFRDAIKLIPYLEELGITDCYTSPYLKATAGSTHGYDITDHNALNPELGSEQDYHEFIRKLQERKMGHILDFVPNHMGIFENPKWQDVLENGPSSPYAKFFDIDWEPVKAELHQKVLLPILEDLYGKVLDEGHISLYFGQAFFIIKYRDHELPIGPKTAVMILESCIDKLKGILPETHPDYLELQSVITACKNLPDKNETEPERVSERRREKDIIKRRLNALYLRNTTIKANIDDTIKNFNGIAGDSASHSQLHELLEKQAYRLCYWRVAAEEINYRRFFDVNELVALRMEDPLVFQESHRLILQLLRDGLLTGIRIDHVDGLFDPYDYLWQLQKAHWLALALDTAKHNIKASRIDPTILKEQLQLMFENKTKREHNNSEYRPIYLIVEKILGDKENLRETWPVEGTTGYDFMTGLNQLFVEKKRQRALLNIYRGFTGSNSNFEDVMYQCKNLVMRTSMSAEINLLAHSLDKVSERSWQYRDFTLNSLRDAIREVIACFPVYRTYINAYRESIDKRDRAIINSSVSQAKRRNPAVSSAIFEFIRDTLLLQFPTGMSEDGRNEQRLFVMRFQQCTGPVMAKGVEDTAFYIYNPLVSLCEVGGNPRKFGNSAGDFHRQNMQRQKAKPYSFMTTSTHDSKRSEDVRARINVLSEKPDEWKTALKQWRRLNKNKKVTANNELVPDNNEEYLLYQTLLGTYPVEKMDKAEADVYCKRIQNYMLKAIREAKVHTSWISPDTSYEDGVNKFVTSILKSSFSNTFLNDFMTFNNKIAVYGIYNSLSQLILKLFSPGVPDIYQGNELWAYNLTDPDNRRPVDFSKPISLLKRLNKTSFQNRNISSVVRKLADTSQDGRIKLYLTWKSLTYRKNNDPLFTEGTYIPLRVAGVRQSHVCAFAWQNGEKRLIVIVPRLVTVLATSATLSLKGAGVWGNTRIALPKKYSGQNYRDIFTNEIITIPEIGKAALKPAEVFKILPIAVLESVSE